MQTKLLILTQYFPPEVGAPQNRLFELATRLNKAGIDVTVLTAMPNYPQMKVHKAYKGKWYAEDSIDGLKVFRSWIYVSSSKSILVRLCNYFSFVFSSVFAGVFKIKGRYDYILCESPPLFLGLSALVLKKLKKAKLIFNVSDLWPETAEKLGMVSNKTLLTISYKLEQYLYQSSVLVTGQTQGICSNIKQRFPSCNTYWLPNGVDMNYYNADNVLNNWRTQNGFSETDLIALYAGIIGHAQGLEVILYAAQKTGHLPHIKYILLGSGPEKEKLLTLNKQLGLTNVFFIDGVAKDKMPEIVAASDFAIIPLKRLELFKGAIPSKIFENLAMKKPILLGVEGEAKVLFIDEGKCGWFFEPENANDLANKIKEIDNNRPALKALGENAHRYVKKNFNRDTIAQQFYEQIIQLNKHS